MNKDNYEVCVPMDDIDNAWMQYYDELWINGRSTVTEDDQHDTLGDKYSKTNADWYYQWCSEENRYYVVVDKKRGN